MCYFSWGREDIVGKSLGRMAAFALERGEIDQDL